MDDVTVNLDDLIEVVVNAVISAYQTQDLEKCPGDS
jgi:hypothetical protein